MRSGNLEVVRLGAINSELLIFVKRGTPRREESLQTKRAWRRDDRSVR